MKSKINTAKQREALAARHEPFWHSLGLGRAIGYRKPVSGAASWKARLRTATGYQHASFDADDFAPALKLATVFFDKVAKGADTSLATVGDAAAAYGRLKPAAVAWHRRLIDNDPIAVIKLERLNREAIRQWLQRHDGPTATLNRRKTALGAVLNFSHGERSVADNHAWASLLTREQESGARQLVLDQAQRRRLVAQLEVDEPLLAPMIRLLCLLPVRVGAAAALTVANFDGTTLTIAKDKANAGRKIALPPAVVALLTEACRNKLPGAPIFHTSKGRHWAGWERQVGNAVRAAGLPAGTCAYTLRHSLISELVMHGVDLLTVAKVSGTSAKLVESTYGHLVHEHVVTALSALSL